LTLNDLIPNRQAPAGVGDQGPVSFTPRLWRQGFRGRPGGSR